MKLRHFINLDNNERTKAALQSTFISERQDDTMYILLYHLGDFFVEVKFNVEKREVSRIRPFNSPHLLEPYLDDLDIKTIFA